MKEKKRGRTKRHYGRILILLSILAGAGLAGYGTPVSEAAGKTQVKAVKINKKNFPDDVFRELVKVNYDKNRDNKLSVREIKRATAFGTSSNRTKIKKKPSKYAEYETKSIQDIKNFKGIEKLTYLKKFMANGTSVKTIDLKKNTRLTYLMMTEGKLRSLDLNKNTKLKYVYLQYNQLKTLKINKCKKLLDIRLDGHMVKNLKIDRNKKTKVSGDTYYVPFDVRTAAVPTSKAGSVMLDTNGNYCMYQWSQDRSICTKLTWSGLKIEQTQVMLGEEAVNTAKSAKNITTQWQDADGNFYFVADANGNLANRSLVSVYQVNGQGILLRGTLLNDQIQYADKAFTITYLNQKGGKVLLKCVDNDSFSNYSVLEFDTAEMSVKKQAKCVDEPLAAEGNVVVLRDGIYKYSVIDNRPCSYSIGICQIGDGEETTLDSGHKISVSTLTAKKLMDVRDCSGEIREAVYVRNETIYAISGDGFFKASLDDSEFKQIYNVSYVAGLRQENTDYQLIVKSENDVCVLTKEKGGEKEKFTLQIGTVKK